MKAFGRYLVVEMKGGRDGRLVAFLSPEEASRLLGDDFVGQDRRRWVVLVDRRARWVPEPGEVVVARVVAIPRPGLVFVEPLAPAAEWGARLLREWGFPSPERLPMCGRVELEILARTWAEDPERAVDQAVRLWGDSVPGSPMARAWIEARATELGLRGLDLRVEDVLHAEKMMAMGASREKVREAVEERIRDRENPTLDPWEVARDRMIENIRSRGICFRAARALMHRARVGVPTPLGDPDEAEGDPELEGAWDAVAQAASVPKQVPEAWEAAKEWARRELRRLVRLLKGMGPDSRCLMRLERPMATVAVAEGLETTREFRASFRCTRGCHHEVILVAEAKAWWEGTGGEYEFGTPRVARDSEPGSIHVVATGIAYIAIRVDGEMVERREV